MEAVLRVLFIDPATGFYRLRRYDLGRYFGPVDLGIHVSDRRGWAEDMLPEIVQQLFGKKEELLRAVEVLASRINSRNASSYWESERNVDFLVSYLRRRRDVEGDANPELQRWIEAFDQDRKEAGMSWWYEMRRGIDEELRAFL